MHVHGARTAVATISGMAVVGALAGCTGASLTTASRDHHGATHHSFATSAPAVSTTQSPTATPSPTPSVKRVVKTTVTAPVHHAPKPTKPTKPSPKPSPSPTSAPPPPPPPSTVYADGSYSAMGSYTSPGGTETLRVSLSIVNDIVKTLSVTSVHVDPTAAEYEARFEAGVGAIVIGRNLANANVGAVAGSSLTSLGYNSALATIRAEAKN